jgi:hypothetical protein
MCSLAEELEGMPIGEVALEIQHAFFNSFEEMVEHVDDIIYYPDVFKCSGTSPKSPASTIK